MVAFITDKIIFVGLDTFSETITTVRVVYCFPKCLLFKVLLITDKVL